MIIDVQRFRDASMSYMGLCDAFLFTPGWRESEGCSNEFASWTIGGRSEPFFADTRDADELQAWIGMFERGCLVRHNPLVYVAGPYLTGVDGPYDEKLFHGSLLLALSCDLNTPHAIDTNAWHLARNIRNGLDWCRRVMDAGGYPYCPWADALLVIASPSEEATS